ncbi:MAG: family 16 glycosylhydrolase, partial [Clostridia bacterium]|nr:family 16 glycosylhydrolase [Clostridia bacterium]
ASAGCPLDLSIAKSAKYDTTPIAEHEILFGVSFKREGIPEWKPMTNYYGVTESGTVYFCSPSPILYPYLLELFLEEWFGVAPGSGEQSGGCTVTACYREIPVFHTDRLKAEGYSVVLDEPFDGDALNLDVWTYRGEGERAAGFFSSSQAAVADGNLILTGEYLNDGAYGEGWYGVAVSLKDWYCRGYYESRIQCCMTTGKGNGDLYSAFWIQGPSPYDPEQSQGGAGPGGAELDILENFGPDCTTCTVHVSGYEGNTGISSQHAEIFSQGNNYVDEYHVYSLLWTEDYYAYYLDGVLLNHTGFGYGTSPAPEEVILSMTVPNGISVSPDVNRIMYVDYLRIWQKP